MCCHNHNLLKCLHPLLHVQCTDRSRLAGCTTAACTSRCATLSTQQQRVMRFALPYQ
jgi:hypothetical protein